MEGDSGLDVLSNDGILDIIPPSEYDPFEAKFCASLFWLVFHATEDGGLEDVPNTVTSPIQRLDKKNGFMVHPEIVEFLCKGEVYCTVCTRIYPGKVPLAGHWSVIQTLSRNGVYVVDDTDIAVTDASLEQRNPFNQGAHIALMDALMTAYSSQAVSIQSVVQAVRRFSTFSASRELPFDLEDALLLWINKTNLAVNDKYTQSTQSTNGKLLRNREQVKKTGLRLEEETVTVMFPVIDDLLKGLCDGRSLLGVLMFYEANVVNMEDICCSPKFSTEDSIRNLDVFLGLCSQYFCTSVLALKIEDILYASPSLKINIVALLAEMFLKCEGNVGSESKPGIPRSKTSCSESGDVGINGHDSCRSHSAPVSRISNVPVAGSASQCKKQKHQDRNIALKIQNYVENESIDFGTASNMTSVNKTSSTTSANITPSQMTSSDVMSPRMTSDMTSPHMSASTMKSSHLTASNVTPSDDVETCDEKNTVEVQGVVVKLRKKVPRSVEPGGGHEALLSRRMKKSLCGWSQEDISESASQTSDNEEGFDVKSDETPTVGTVHEPSVLTPDPSDLALPNELHLNLNLDLHSPDDLPVDILSPISETTEPGGSAGNSLNNSMSSTHDQREFRHQGDSEGGMDIDLCPPIAQTPRKSNNQSFAKDNSIPRGSYIISDANHTLESAFAAGIPVVERASRSSTSQSSEGPLLYGSGFVNNGIYEQSNDARELSNANSCGSSNFHDQEYPSGTITREQTRVPDQRDDKRFSTFTKSKSRDGKSKVFDSKDTEYSESTEQYGDIDKGDIHKRDIHKGLVKTSSDTKNCKKNTGPTITWSSQAKDEERSVDDGGACSESTVKKTNWGEMAAEMSESSSVIEKDSSDSPQADPVSRELNLLRLRLAEKQRDIEAQKQRTKEQQEEERKRFGQNVFWLAVGKGRERKDGVEVNSPTKKFSQSANLKPYTNDVGNDVTKMEPSNNNKFATFTKQSSLDEDLPPSMGKLQDRTYDIKYNSLSKSVPEEKQPLSNKCREDGNPALEDRKSSLEDRNSSDDVVQFRLSRQPPGTQGQSLGQIPPENSEKPKTSVLNYNSRINVPVSVPNKLIPENNQDTVNAKNSEIIADGYKQEHLNSKNEAELATSPQRKCWNTEEAINSEPCMAVSESNYDIFDQKYEKIAKSVETPESTEVIHSEIKDGLVETGNCNRVGSDSSGHGDDGDMDDLKKIPEESSGSLAAEDETPKKGLALFIGEENTVSNDDGLTPEQLRKREKFLRNRQQKIEEDKMKKEVLLEKKRRKEEKMREIQLRREQEEQDRQAKLQEKREQAELAKQERQKYEIKRKENLTKMNFNDGTLQGNYGYSRMAMNPPDRIPSGNLGYNRTGMDTQDGISGGNERHVRSNVKTPTTGGNVFEVHRPAQSTTPSAFSGFTGVQSYVKPSGKTNRKLIINAISYVCLPGTVNKETKEKCLQAMTESSAQHFLILFKEGLKFRSLYSLDLESNQVLKVFGIGPRSVTEKMIDKLFKYNSGGKDFSKIPAKGFSLSVDGFTLQKSCWQSNKPPVQSKTASNFKPSTSLYKSAR